MQRPTGTIPCNLSGGAERVEARSARLSYLTHPPCRSMNNQILAVSGHGSRDPGPPRASATHTDRQMP